MEHSDNLDNVGNIGLYFCTIGFWILKIIRLCLWFLDSISEWVKYLYSSLKITILNNLTLQKPCHLRSGMKTKIVTLSSFCHRYMCTEVTHLSSPYGLWTISSQWRLWEIWKCQRQLSLPLASLVISNSKQEHHFLFLCFSSELAGSGRQWPFTLFDADW